MLPFLPMDLNTVATLLLAIWLSGSAAAAAVVGRSIRLRDEHEPERG